MKKIIAALLAMLMVLTVAAGCGGSKASEAPAPAPAQSGEQADPFAKLLEISYAANYGADQPDDFSSKRELEEMFNVKITIANVDLNSDWSTFQMIVAAGDMPDFVSMNSSITQVLTWYDEEVIRAVPKATVRQFAPNFAKTADTYSPVGWDLFDEAKNKDNMMAIPGYFPGSFIESFWASTYRLDWLENLGITPNGKVEMFHPEMPYLYYTDKGFTLEQFEDIMYQFKNNDPDKSGQNDITPIGAVQNIMFHSFQGIASAFGLAGELNVEENGRTIRAQTSLRYKDFLKYVANLYANDLIDKDFFNMNWADLNEKMAAGKYGYFATPATYTHANPIQREERSGVWGYSPMPGIAANPEGKILVAPHETGADGKSYSALYGTSPWRYQIIFNYKTSDEKVERILTMLDFARFDGATRTRFARGIEGVNYTLEPDGYGGNNIRSVPAAELPDDAKGIPIFSQMWTSPYEDESRFQTFMAKRTQEILRSDTWMSFAYGPHRLDLKNETQLAAKESEYNATINTIIREYWAGAIAGNFTVDATWDSYIADLNAAGYEEILDELNKAPLWESFFPERKGQVISY